MNATLQPELVPRPLWRRSVHRRLRNTGRRSEWERIRRAVLADAKNTCHYCHAVYSKGMVCHEEWDYDEEHGVVTLSGFAVSCQLCNFALHIGMASASDVDRGEEAREHMMKVNGMTREQVDALVRDAFVEWRSRSELEWRFEIAPDVVERFSIVVEVLGEQP